MNTSDDSEDEVTRAYRRASDAQAGWPSADTRAAILAEARAATLRRTPAANDSRYTWRAVAGIAVLGVAVLLWKQADRHVAPDLTVAKTETLSSTETAVEAERGDAVPEAPVADMRQVAADRSVATQSAKAEQDEARPASPSLRESESKRAEESAGAAIASVAVPAADSLGRASANAPLAQAAGAMRKDTAGPDYQQLLQREFPEIWNGERAASTVWVILDADSKVVRKGVLSERDTLTAVGAAGSWNTVQVKTASGSSLQLAVANVD